MQPDVHCSKDPSGFLFHLCVIVSFFIFSVSVEFPQSANILEFLFLFHNLEPESKFQNSKLPQVSGFIAG